MAKKRVTTQNMHEPPAPKDLTKVQRFTEEQKELITNTVAKLYLEGFSYRAMAIWIKENKNISITHTTVSAYVNKVMDDWRKERISKIDDLLIIELQGLNRVEREAWDGWYRSLNTKTKNVSKRKGLPQKSKSKDGKEVLNVSTTEVEDIEETSNTDGNPKFLEIIKDCKSKRIDLLLRLQGNTPPTPDGGTTNNTYVQQIVNVNVVQRKKPLTLQDIE
jgi:hypothetical protein